MAKELSIEKFHSKCNESAKYFSCGWEAPQTTSKVNYLCAKESNLLSVSLRHCVTRHVVKVVAWELLTLLDK